jgi:hypothetical protein
MKAGRQAYKHHGLVLFLVMLITITAVLLPPLEKISLANSVSVKLFGFVKDFKGIPISNAMIGVSDENYKPVGNFTTAQNGYYEFVVGYSSIYNISVQHYSSTVPYVLDYTFQAKTIETGNLLEIRTDFILKPAGNIALYSYGSEGELLRNKQFREATGIDAYVTDLNDLPDYGTFFAIGDDYSSESISPWDMLIPAFIVPVQTPVKIHVQWEVPEFGKIMVTMDNEGQGYSVAEQSGLLTLNFNYEAAKSKVSAFEKDYSLFKSQGYEFSNSVELDLILSKEHMAKGEGYLFQVPTSDMKGAVKEFNEALKYTFWAHEQLHLEKAETDIKKYRMGNMKLKVVDGQGTLVPNCPISFNQTSHDFLFGANPMGKAHKFDIKYARLMRDAGINYTYLICTWNFESSPGIFDWSFFDSYQDIGSLTNNGFKLLGGLALWFMRNNTWAGDSMCPYYQDDMTFEQLKENIYNHMNSLATRYKDKINTWEISEQNISTNNALRLSWNQKLETYRVFAKAVTDANPNARVLHTSTALPYERGGTRLESLDEVAGGISYPEFLDLVFEKQVPIDIIGLELYYSGVTTFGGVQPQLDLACVSNLLNQYSVYGKPIFIHEVSAPSTQVPNSSWWHKSWDQETQAEYITKFYTLAFSKPLVQEIGWSFGVTDGDIYIISGGLLDNNLNPKAGYFALQKLINSWKTTGTGKTDENGKFEFRGFAGDYELNLATADGQVLKTTIHVNEQQTKDVTIEFPPVIDQKQESLSPPEQEEKPPSATDEEQLEPQPADTTPAQEVSTSDGNSLPIIIGAVSGIVIVGTLILIVIKKRARKTKV